MCLPTIFTYHLHCGQPKISQNPPDHKHIPRSTDTYPSPNYQIQFQRKYQEAVENGEIIEGDQMFESLLENEPWFMRNMASHLLTEKQAAQVEKQVSIF
jgi:hypothetical protein